MHQPDLQRLFNRQNIRIGGELAAVEAVDVRGTRVPRCLSILLSLPRPSARPLPEDAS